MTLNKSFLTGALASFFGLILLGEAFLRLTVPAGLLYRSFDFSGDMTSLSELRDRIRYAVPRDRRILLLGDSVLGASALVEHRTPEGRSQTLGRFLESDLKDRGWNALSLAADGLLLPDLEALSVESGAAPPQRELLLLNFRMFAKDYASGAQAVSRRFLIIDLPGDEQAELAKPSTQEERLGDFLYDGLCRRCFLFRETQMAKTLWYYPSQKDFFQRLLEKAVPPDEMEEDLVEAGLKWKVAPYYQPYLWDRTGLPFRSLGRMLDHWKRAGIPVSVVLTPQNRDFLGSALDEKSFESNRRALAAFLRPREGALLSYADWSGRYPASRFFDHCHLRPEGNKAYARDLAVLLCGKGAP